MENSFANPGNTMWEYTGEFRDDTFAGLFQLSDPDGLKSVAREGFPETDLSCVNGGYGLNPFRLLLPFVVVVIDCEQDMDTTRWLIEDDPSSDRATITCIEGSCLQMVGGELLPIETTSLLLAGAQTFSWMIPVTLSVLGIGLVLARKK